MYALSFSMFSLFLTLSAPPAVDSAPGDAAAAPNTLVAQAGRQPPAGARQPQDSGPGGRGGAPAHAEEQSRSRGGGRGGSEVKLNSRGFVDGDPELRVYQLQYASPKTVSQFINVQWGDVTTPDDRTNRLIYLGPPEYLAKVDLFVKTLDTPAAESPSEQSLEIVQIVHRDPRDIVIQLSQTSLRKDANFSADSARSMILLDGPPETIKRIKSVIAALDQAQISTEVEFVFFLGSAKPVSATREKLETPGDLAAVAEELKRFGDIEYLARMSGVMTQDEPFQLSGGVGRRADIEIQGRMDSGTAAGPITLSIQAELRLIDQDGKAGPRFTLKTAMTTKRDEFLVLGSAPSGWDPGESVILAVRIPSASNE